MTAIILELLLERVLAEHTGAAGPFRLRYGGAGCEINFRRWFRLVEYGNTSRAAALAETRAKNSFGKQLRGAALQMLGPMAVFSAGLAGYLLPMVMPVVLLIVVVVLALAVCSSCSSRSRTSTPLWATALFDMGGDWTATTRFLKVSILISFYSHAVS